MRVAIPARLSLITSRPPSPNAASTCNGKVLVFDTTTNTIVDTVLVGIAPFFVAVSPDAKRVYVSNRGSHTVSVIDAATREVVSTIATAQVPGGLAVTPDGSRVYLATVSGTVLVIDTNSNAVVATIQDSVDAFQVAITPDGTRAYVTHGDLSLNIFNNTVSVIDTATDKLTAVIPNPDNCSFGIAMAPLIPQTKDDCTNGGYQRFRSLAFRNQGQCIKYVVTRTRPSL